MSKVKVFMFGHTSNENHGCEAIIRSTSDLINRAFNNKSIKVASFNHEKDTNIYIKNIDGYISHCTEIRKYTIPWIKTVYFNKVSKDFEKSYIISQREAIQEAVSSDICLSVGGDNYCYGEPVHLYAMNRVIKRSGKKLVLWGASIDTTAISDRMEEDLRSFDALFIRESITFNELKRRNINKNLFLYPDPAFTLEKEELPLPGGWVRNKMIGINVSPLIIRYEKGYGKVLLSFTELIKHIISSTDFNIVLVPHVTIEGNNDYDVLKDLYERFRDSGRIVLLDQEYTAAQLKGFISSCRFFIGTRTHATIAAYSSCVPTLALGYSVKARGIARDIFGDEKHFVIPVQHLLEPNQVIKEFDFILTNENLIRNHLESFMPKYISKAEAAMLKLKEIIKIGKDEGR
ncbi:polysaccharide pyruvyl transferase family protein [Clostridium thermarum]|uniref:polysaccharide pyruvyl transferase family protein n=1 Tax=Clostridium thermarum TaxID=1716543 RepID=UPI0013D25D5D|nr:polysaccharide pyruvyl transferase family protein [Clostridium thermarum]